MSQVKELCALGFSDKSRCHDMLRQSGGDVRGALVLLQRPLLQPFHSQIWSEEPEPPVDIYHPDKQVSRRIHTHTHVVGVHISLIYVTSTSYL